jgi:hypothetical protein
VQYRKSASEDEIFCTQISSLFRREFQVLLGQRHQMRPKAVQDYLLPVEDQEIVEMDELPPKIDPHAPPLPPTATVAAPVVVAAADAQVKEKDVESEENEPARKKQKNAVTEDSEAEVTDVLEEEVDVGEDGKKKAGTEDDQVGEHIVIDADEDKDEEGGVKEKKKKKKKKKAGTEDDESEDSEDKESGKERAERLKQEKYATNCEKWATSDDRMKQFQDHADSNTNLLNASNKDTKKWAKAADDLWQDYLDKDMFLPKKQQATWNQMPAAVKVWGFLRSRRKGLPWSVKEFDNKARARLSKMRTLLKYKTFRQDPKNAVYVNESYTLLWMAWREEETQDGNMAPEEGAAAQLATAVARIAALEAELDPNRRARKYFFYTCFAYVNFAGHPYVPRREHQAEGE